MSTALDPNVTPLLVYAGIAVLVIASFVGAILVVLGRVRAWLKVMFLEFSESKAFEAAIERLLDRIADKMTSRLEARMSAIEERDKERMDSVRRSFQQTDELSVRLNTRIDQLFEIQSRVNTKESTP
jgi:hypothetical protein